MERLKHSWLWLTVSLLLTACGSGREAYVADVVGNCWQEGVVVRVPNQDTLSERELKLCREMGIEVVASTDSTYPEQLRFVADYPHIIYMVGNTSLLTRGKLCAIMGERDSISSYGEKMVYRLLEQIADIAPEVVIVGALEGGADTVALRCAHHFGLRCIGVTDSPLSQIVPQSCERIAAEILDNM